MCLYEVMIHILFKVTGLNHNCRITYQRATSNEYFVLLFTDCFEIIGRKWTRVVAFNSSSSWKQCWKCQCWKLVRRNTHTEHFKASGRNCIQSFNGGKISSMPIYIFSLYKLFQQYFNIYLISLDFRVP